VSDRSGEVAPEERTAGGDQAAGQMALRTRP
jgi:hypothetical protein